MAQLFEQLREFLSEVENEKKASFKKRAAANTEPGSQGGSTSHPSKDIDDGTFPATEGSRSSENSSDVKKTITNGGVDSSSDDFPSQEDQQFNVGITSTSTGEDPSNEDDYKSDKEDPGTSHPAKTNDGEKYSSVSFSKLRKMAESKANDILSDLAYSVKEASNLVQGYSEGNTSTSRYTEQEKYAAAGYSAASLQEGYTQDDVLRAHEGISSSVESTIADGIEKAAMVGSYLAEFYKAAEGEASGEGVEGAEHEQQESPSAEAAEGAGMDVDPAMLDTMAGGEEQGSGNPDDAAQELLMALQEQGIEPEQLLEMIQAQGGEGGAPAPEEAAMPKMGSSRAVTKDLVNLIKYSQAYRRAGRFSFTEAKTAQQRNLRDQIKMCVRDIVG
jgi:hypothetical protein